MTGNKDYLAEYQSQNGDTIIYGDDVKNNVIGKGTLNINGMPKINNILHADGLRVNLINISQLRDENLIVTFTKELYNITNQQGEQIFNDLKSDDNCYKSTELTRTYVSYVIRSIDINAWHKNLSILMCKF